MKRSQLKHFVSNLLRTITTVLVTVGVRRVAAQRFEFSRVIFVQCFGIRSNFALETQRTIPKQIKLIFVVWWSIVWYCRIIIIIALVVECMRVAWIAVQCAKLAFVNKYWRESSTSFRRGRRTIVVIRVESEFASGRRFFSWLSFALSGASSSRW